MNVKEYREKHRRCRTCIHSKNLTDMLGVGNWACNVRKTTHLGTVEETILAGIFCPTYEPVKEGE